MAVRKRAANEQIFFHHDTLGLLLVHVTMVRELVDSFLGGPELIIIVFSVRQDSIERRLRIVLICYS